MLIGWSLWLGLDVPCIDATELVREEPLQIRAITANPQAFNMRTVRLQGIITTLEVIPDGGGCQVQGIYDAYVFILKDDTGELQIFDRGHCHSTAKSRPHAVKPQMTEFAAGDSVEVVIDISLLYSPNFESRSLEGALRWIKRIPHLNDASGASP